jgi:2-polyprenyl-3-methyl-5-hydroxy-6-metoxy-1,4-benzoquinol methylase
MPVPKGGLAQHYGMNADDYFEHHDVNTKSEGALSLLRRAGELTGGKGRLLDIGSGRGELLSVAQLEGWTPVGIEPSPSFAEHAMKHSGAEIRCMPVEECGFDTGSFDVVVLSAVLEHLYNPDQTISEVSRILRAGGALFLDVPNELGLYFRVGNLYQRSRGRNWVVNTAPTFSPFHVFGFSPRSLRALLSKHKLKPRDWRVYPGEAMVPSRGGPIGACESIAAKAVTALSKIGSLGTYIETWAAKSG